MLRAMLRDLLAHKARLAMTLAAITLGVAFVVAAWVVAESTARTLAGGDTRQDVAVAVQSTADPSPLTAADAERLGAAAGVDSATGVRTGRSGLVGPNGELVGDGLDHAGSNWDGTGRYTLVSGQPPRDSGEVALRSKEAAKAGLSVGDRARVVLPEGRSDTFTVAGTFHYRPLGPRSTGDGTTAEPEPVPIVAHTPEAARDLFGDRFDRIELAAEPGSAPSAIAEDAARLLGSGDHRVATGAELADEAEQAARETASNTRDQLLPFAAVALLAGAFVIANTFATLAVQRTRRFALLRAVGARRAQVRRAVVAEAALLGVAGATLGVCLGSAGGLLAFTAMDPAGADSGGPGAAVPPSGIAAGYLAGVGVTVLAAYGSARRAAAVPPMSALRAGAEAPAASTAARSLVGVLAVLLGAVAITVTASPSVDAVQRIVGIGGAVLAVVGCLLLIPAAVRAVLRPLARIANRYGGVATRLGLRNAARDPRRTAATASALMVGLTLIGVFATLSASLTSLATSSIRATLPDTTTIVRPEVADASLDPADVSTIEELPEVSTAVASADELARIRHGQGSAERIVTAVDPDGFTEVLRPEIVAGSADLSRGALISKNQADMLGLAPGDAITLEFDAGAELDTTVAGTYEGTEMQASLYYDAAEVPEDARADTTMVHATGPDPEAAREAIADAFADRPDVAVRDRQGHIDDRIAQFRLGLLVSYAMFGFAVVIGVFGVVNTLTLAVMERVREIGVLRAVGANRRLVRRAIRVESVVLSVFGGLLGVASGVGAGTVVQHSMLGQRLSDVTIPFPLIGAALVAMVAIGVVAAVWPARRATRIEVVAAIADE
ncbi:putative ABC transport system permease protein [Lipingzhangella halophila]|uniref:Putative ABC transport system permease protein n=1 Tax=Lipingzhangella halophila TaxID=1783352 RepID=A0A7W7RI70_9ACTN|nr:ABC transporter permease [Lipingzhangella halophila]MBB4932360.1 putative ABC transport system permease protein [Lipingzhangella halophila]